MREDKKEREALGDRIRRSLDIDKDILSGGYSIESSSNERVTVRGSGRILTYTPTEIKVEVSEGELTLCGESLVCSSYFAGAVVVEGKIRQIIFGGEGE